ncbi:unnamed protein product [Lampetra fluviatilis]
MGGADGALVAYPRWEIRKVRNGESGDAGHGGGRRGSGSGCRGPRARRTQPWRPRIPPRCVRAVRCSVARTRSSVTHPRLGVSRLHGEGAARVTSPREPCFRVVTSSL